ncbi:8-oxoguanine DNA glycosylase [Novilysobacter selenitireducens]|uniref:8-oxoguanine DNA glycosylase n=1 Tax=Novilysobacter selenitireducens TaxID=2872639 RepID=A0ABS7T2H5_9GAMM|nr:8-oxoguanine DNA glycosylase [Lysobacter selenitireducens]MBZ4038074.1 8-oxoguanine DNA glycosylase [Lysobacter selenitireducens]
MQRAYVTLESMAVSVDLPPPEAEVLPGVRWGHVEAFPTPAYWAYQVMARRIEARQIKYRLGQTLREEVGACLLGGHGIPAKVGLLAFEHLKSKGAFDGSSPGEEILREWLSEPMQVDGRSIRYRFAGQKARYLAAALERLASQPSPSDSGRALRDWLTRIPGVGYKTASWVARNWLDADDVAILDIHILRAGVFAKFLDAELTVERDYLALEQQFLSFSHALGVRPSELDAVIWWEMMASPNSVARVLEALPEGRFKERHAPSRTRTKNRRTDSPQLALIG